MLKILFIGNDEWIRNSMIMFFEDEGCRLQTVDTAEEALAEIQKHHYDLIISDNVLPGMDGLEFFRRTFISIRNTIKILIVLDKSRFLVESSKNVGIHDLIEKPFKPETIEASLTNILK